MRVPFLSTAFGLGSHVGHGLSGEEKKFVSRDRLIFFFSFHVVARARIGARRRGRVGRTDVRENKRDERVSRRTWSPVMSSDEFSLVKRFFF